MQTSMASKSKFDELDLSKDEIKRIGDALKDEQFRKLFVEYAEEISDPENRKRYEEEIQMLENEKGMNVEFVNPNPGYVLKTSAGNKKAFINICTSDKIGKPEADKQTNAEGKRGLAWRIPHSFSPPRDDLDKQGQTCTVYDVVFHPDTFRMADNPRFKTLVEDTAIEGIQRQFEVKIDRKNITRPKLKYKGAPVATVIRSKQDTTGNEPPKHPDPNDPLKDLPYPYDDLTSEEKANLKNKMLEKKEKTEVVTEKKNDKYTEPKFHIIHRSDLELQQYTNAPDSRPTTRPKELVVTIELPLLKSAAGVDLDIFEDKMILLSEKPAYKLDTKLPYAVDDSRGSAKFDKTNRCLIVTLPVIPGDIPEMPSFINDDTPCLNGKEKLEAQPFIEELPPLEPLPDDGVQEADDLPALTDIVDADAKNATTHPAQDQSTHETANRISDIMYSLPLYDFDQDCDTVSFVFQVRNVTSDSLLKQFFAPNSCQVKFVSVGMGGFPVHYSIYLKFLQGCAVVPEHCTVDITDKNLVLTMLKERACKGLWNSFEAGPDEASLEEKIFVIEASLQSELDKLDGDASMVEHNSGTDDKPNIHVPEMNRNKLTININKANSKNAVQHDDDEKWESDDECPTSADIEVVEEKVVTNLHSILKQRSISESSEDPSSVGNVSSDSVSPVVCSPRDSDGIKKSVSFNSHIDQTTFKTNSAVTTMTAILKSKRRRNRKREEKQRRRHNSTGSECSSCDSHSEDDHEDLADMISETSRKIASTGVIEEEPTEKSKSKGNPNQAGVQVEHVSSTVDVESSTQAGKGKVEKGQKYQFVEEVKNKLTKNSCQQGDENDSDDDDADVNEQNRMKKVGNKEVANDAGNMNAGSTSLKTTHDGTRDSVDGTVQSDERHSSTAGTNGQAAVEEQGHETEGKKQTNKKRRKGNKQKKEGDGKVKSETKDESEEKVENKVNAVVKAGKSKQETKPEPEQQIMNNKNNTDVGKEVIEEQVEKSENVESVIDWSEPAAKKGDSNDHVTQCAFEFSNAVMFDLDID